MKTWHLEAALVGFILFVVNLLFGHHWYEWIGAIAVFFTFMNTQVASRLEEAEALREAESGNPNVECYRWLNRYFLVKEASWFIYFVILGAWSALVGVFIFLAYPYWRRFWTKRRLFLMKEAASKS